MNAEEQVAPKSLRFTRFDEGRWAGDATWITGAYHVRNARLLAGGSTGSSESAWSNSGRWSSPRALERPSGTALNDGTGLKPPESKPEPVTVCRLMAAISSSMRQSSTSKLSMF